MKVTFYTKERCSLCELAFAMILDLREEISFELKIVDITMSDDAWEASMRCSPLSRLGRRSSGEGSTKRDYTAVVIEEILKKE